MSSRDLPTDEQTALDALLARHIGAQEPGVAVAVVRDGQVVYERGHGLANLEWGIPIASDTVFRLGSLTKPFTAQAVMLLQLAGKLTIDAPISSYLPELTWLDPRITVAHLLTHTSGIANFVTQPGFQETVARQDHTPAALAARIGAYPPDFAPGERYSYSNSGYELLGMLVARVAGLPYDEYLRGAILEPLGMHDSRVLWQELVVPRRASGYQHAAEAGRGYQRARYLSTTLANASGGLASTLRDLIRWDAALREQRQLPAEVEVRMRQPVRLNEGRALGYGLGWGLSRYRDRDVVYHTGGVPGFSSYLGRFLADGVTIIILSNRGLFDASGLAAEIANYMLRLPAPPRVPQPASDAELRAAVGTYTNPIGERLELARAGDRLTVRGDLTADLVPLGDATYADPARPDVTLRFAALSAEGYRRATAVVPFYWFEVERVRGEG
jgi:CubicO group peptidase (beta-lactamase class C family)